jgi:hypothetical protein
VDSDGALEETTYQGTILANSTKTQSIILIRDEDRKKIEIKDPSGNILFSHDYNRKELEQLEWKIVISP